MMLNNKTSNKMSSIELFNCIEKCCLTTGDFGFHIFFYLDASSWNFLLQFWNPKDPMICRGSSLMNCFCEWNPEFRDRDTDILVSKFEEKLVNTISHSDKKEIQTYGRTGFFGKNDVHKIGIVQIVRNQKGRIEMFDEIRNVMFMSGDTVESTICLFLTEPDKYVPVSKERKKLTKQEREKKQKERTVFLSNQRMMKQRIAETDE